MPLALVSLHHLERYLPLLGTLDRLWNRHPRNIGGIGRWFDQLATVNPIVVLALVLVVSFLIAVAVQQWKVFVPVCLLLPFASLLLLPSGWTVIHNANKVAIGKRPFCLAESILNGAPWDSSRMAQLADCTAPGKHIILDTNSGTKDTGADGKLQGTVEGENLDSSNWKATATTETPARNWFATSQSGPYGLTDTYLNAGPTVYQIAACPKAPVSQSALTDKTGQTFVEYVYKYLTADSISNLLDTADRMEKAPGGRLALFNSLRHVIGYVLPVSGVRGDCAVISGPYQLVAGQPELQPSPSAAQSQFLEWLALHTSVGGLH